MAQAAPESRLTIRLTHSVRPASRIFWKNDGTLEAAERIAGHADSRITKLYERRGQKVILEGYGEDSVLS
jgi:hypothetical protein